MDAGLLLKRFCEKCVVNDYVMYILLGTASFCNLFLQKAEKRTLAISGYFWYKGMEVFQNEFPGKRQGRRKQ